MCSYVVSLLRPEIIRELRLPRHGLEILPLESTMTPFAEGGYLARWADHDQTRRELYRHSPRDADAYDDFSKLMYQLAVAVKPVLSMVPPDPTSLHPRDLLGFAKLAKHFRGLGAEQFHALYKLMTMSSADYLDEWFETEALKATMAASGIIGTFLGPRSPGTAYVLLHHYMGEIDGAMRAWGFARGGTGGISESIASAARSYGAEIRTEADVAQVIVKNGKATGVGARERRRAARACRSIRPRPEADVSGSARREAPARRLRPGHSSLQDSGILGQGESVPERAARLHVPPRLRATPSRHHLDQPERGVSRARL